MGALSIEHRTNMGSVGMNVGMQSGFRFWLSRDDNLKTLPSKTSNASLASCTYSATHDFLSSFSCLDLLSMQTALNPQSAKTSALGVLDFQNRVCLEEPSAVKENRIQDQSIDAITWKSSSGIAIPSQQGSNISQPSSQIPSLFERLSADDGVAEFPSIGTFLDILQNCRTVSSLEYAKQAFLHLCHNGLEAQKNVGNYLVPILVECGAIDYAKQVFHRLEYRNEHSWTALIQGHVTFENYEQALTLYKFMHHELIEPSNFTIVFLLKACAHENDVEMGKFFHAEIAKRGTEEDSFVGSVLVDMYSSVDYFQKQDMRLIRCLYKIYFHGLNFNHLWVCGMGLCSRSISLHEGNGEELFVS
ncbi:hypothetical protein L7F22_000842 [Adiantum nelumboides]|nr:hypothetical protein [Adiantum nelumboides]